MRFVQKKEIIVVQDGGRSGTPVLEMPNITKLNTIKVTVTFLAKTGGQANSGFAYSIAATNSDDVIVLSSTESIVQGNAGWQTTTKTVLFEAKVNSQTGVEDVDFEVLFSKGGLEGAGEISEFLMTGEIVSIDRS